MTGDETVAPPQEAQRRRSRRWLWALCVIGVAIAAAAIWRARSAPSRANTRAGQNSALSVGVAKVTTGDMPVMLNALGTVTPLATVTVRAQVGGILTRVAFSEGQMVRAGDLLAEIDARPYQAALDQAKGNLQRDEAQLANAKVDLSRYQKLLSDNSVSHQQYDTQAALVQQDEAAIATDRALVESAQLNRDYCRITSPVSGRVGLRQVDPGNLLQANAATGIAVVTQMQPISVVFTVPEDSVHDVVSRLHGGDKLMVDGYDRAQANKLASGVLSATDNEIDTTTGTLKLRAQFDNADLGLFPNQFVNVRMLLDTLHDQTLVPAAALQNGASGTFVYVVDGQGTATMRVVTAGATDGERIVVNSGLQAGETLVVDGADQLRDGQHVNVAGSGQAAAPAARGNGQRGASGRRGNRQGGAGNSGTGTRRRGGDSGTATPE